MKKVLIYLIYACGLLSLIAFALVRLDKLPSWMKPSDIKRYGDLYKMNYIAHFDELLPEPGEKFQDSEMQNDINDAELLIFGDSFFEYDKNVNVPEIISKQSGLTINFQYKPQPVKLLLELQYKKAERKYLIFEVAERGIPELFGMKDEKERGITIDFTYEKLDRIYLPDAEKKYSTILEKSLLTYHLHKFVCTAKFNWFGFIPNFTPVYSVDPPFLFYEPTVSDEPGGFYHEYSVEEYDYMVARIKELSDYVDEAYNLEFLPVFIPNKYTIHHDVIQDETYNNFLPILQSRLAEEGIRTVDIHDRFKDTDELLYYPTDTHWNEKGIRIAADAISKALEEKKL